MAKQAVPKAPNGAPKPSGALELVESVKLNLQGYTLIEGFPGMGLVGTIGAKYVVEKLNFKEVGYVSPRAFAPIIRIHEGLPMYPARLYVNERLKTAVLFAEQMIPKNETHAVAELVSHWIVEKKIKRVVSLSGISTETMGDTTIYGIAANERSRKWLKESGVQVIQEGFTTGMTALIMLALKNQDIEAVSLMGNVHIGADYKASADIVKKLSEMLGLKLDVAPLMEEGKAIEEQFRKQLDQHREAQDTVNQIEDQPPMYA